MKILIILNERPAADEKAYNAIRIAAQIQKDDSANQVFIYLIADGVYCALANAEGMKGTLNVEEMLSGVVQSGGTVKMCTSCGESRELINKQLIKGAEWTNLKTLTDWIAECDKVINY
ncbi:MAG TPA: DsrE family protein [Flavobacteriales bacterium]|nr:DsrE family protein [Flavobacteriales bacterium]